MRLNAESSSRPLTPSPLCEGGGGVAKRTSVISQSYKAYLRYVFRVEGNFSSPASPKRRGGGTGAGWYIRSLTAKGIKDEGERLISFCL